MADAAGAGGVPSFVRGTRELLERRALQLHDLLPRAGRKGVRTHRRRADVRRHRSGRAGLGDDRDPTTRGSGSAAACVEAGATRARARECFTDRLEATATTPSVRFDVVVWNHGRLEAFLPNFGTIDVFQPERDRLTIVSSSAS